MADSRVTVCEEESDAKHKNINILIFVITATEQNDLWGVKPHTKHCFYVNRTELLLINVLLYQYYYTHARARTQGAEAVCKSLKCRLSLFR